MILKQFLRKRAKIWRGIRRTLFQSTSPYDSGTFWDQEFFSAGISDRQTIAADKSIMTAAYHYASVEGLILRHLINQRISLDGARCCDLGSGSGHWINFYLSLGAARCTGIDVSKKSVEHLREKFAADTRIDIHWGRLLEALPGGGGPFDLVNAIGVMFHIVEDREWMETIMEVGRCTRPGGLFVVGGHFGWLARTNVQFDKAQRVNKRLRGAREWRRALAAAGFENVTIYRNRAYRFVRDSLPENNVLVAHKR